MYAPVTVKLNRMGHLELWHDMYTCLTRECEVYIQSADDVSIILSDMTADDREELEKGWIMVVNTIPEEYFTAIS